jgi:3-methyladenine DNA glycosylase AlkC
MLATFIFGHCAATSSKALRFLRERVSKDEDWRVQEILAQAFDLYCKAKGYEQSLPVIENWLLDPNPNVRRAATEGVRIWTTRPYFKLHPEIAIELLSGLRNDRSDTVRRSVGNALRDISRKHPQLVRNELATWDVTDPRAAQVHKLANRFLA